MSTKYCRRRGQFYTLKFGSVISVTNSYWDKIRLSRFFPYLRHEINFVKWLVTINLLGLIFLINLFLKIYSPHQSETVTVFCIQIQIGNKSFGSGSTFSFQLTMHNFEYLFFKFGSYHFFYSQGSGSVPTYCNSYRILILSCILIRYLDPEKSTVSGVKYQGLVPYLWIRIRYNYKM
jgi:hypothetical protein